MNINDIIKCINEIDIDSLNELEKIIKLTNNIIIIGNGGSNAIASHISQDYTKSLGKKSISFSDSARLTCYINDYGIEKAYAKFIEHFADNETLVILISSSGNSINILNAAEYCKSNKINMITLSGFDRDNKLKKYTNESLIHFWVDSIDYGVVECTHQIILHSVL